MLTDRQVEAYRRDGYLVVPRLIEGEQLAALRALTDRIVSEARGVAASDALYDLEPGLVLPGLGRVGEMLAATESQRASVVRLEDGVLSVHRV